MYDAPLSIPEGLADALRAAQHVTVLTGAGVSRESGLPTFREAQTGLWARYRPEDLATPEAFERDPRLVWEWYTWRRDLVAQAEPNPGHLALAELGRRAPCLTLITQNVDGLHRVAGSQDVIELHGNINRTKCAKEGVVIESWGETGDIPPRCPHCGSLLRPDVVWFGETLPADALQSALEAAHSCDLFFSIGTSSVVEPAASLPREALRQGAVVVEVNLRSTLLTPEASYVVQAPSASALPLILQAAWPDARGAVP